MANPLSQLAVRAAAAAATRQIASRVSGAQLGAIGNVAAVALPFVLRRVSPFALAAMAIGAWGVGKLAKPALPAAHPDAPQAKLLTTSALTPTPTAAPTAAPASTVIDRF